MKRRYYFNSWPDRSHVNIRELSNEGKYDRHVVFIHENNRDENIGHARLIVDGVNEKLEREGNLLEEEFLIGKGTT